VIDHYKFEYSQIASILWNDGTPKSMGGYKKINFHDDQVQSALKKYLEHFSSDDAWERTHGDFVPGILIKFSDESLININNYIVVVAIKSENGGFSSFCRKNTDKDKNLHRFLTSKAAAE